MKLKKMLDLWQKNTLITQEQVDNIKKFMKERRKNNFFRLLKWLTIIGSLYIIGGGIATVYNIFELDLVRKILEFFSKHLFRKILLFIQDYIILPIHNIVIQFFGDNSIYFYLGLVASILFIIFNECANRTSKNKKIDTLNISEEQKYILKSNYLFYTLAAVSLAAYFYFFNRLLVPSDSYWYSQYKIFPIFNVLGAITFIIIAYVYSRAMYLLFGIFFVALSVGMFFGYSHACYWIGVSRPLIQILISLILLLVGYITSIKTSNTNSETTNYRREKFSSIYNWTGLLMLFLALWIASLWGFDIYQESEKSFVVEIVIANVLFILTSIGTMFYGVKKDSKLFFNYGLTFIFIETYTLFFKRLWTCIPFGLAALIFGILLVITSKILKKTYLKKLVHNKKNEANNN